MSSVGFIGRRRGENQSNFGSALRRRRNAARKIQPPLSKARRDRYIPHGWRRRLWRLVDARRVRSKARCCFGLCFNRERKAESSACVRIESVAIFVDTALFPSCISVAHGYFLCHLGVILRR